MIELIMVTEDGEPFDLSGAIFSVGYTDYKGVDKVIESVDFTIEGNKITIDDYMLPENSQ